ncbi:hypothetical protein PN36_25785 [Candidatus Thiomargarita nelsonii]|uniref:GPI inositol-deacylase PGAP1-like alpha/beta domain-containing protein n=1 Tax=Candidatus Thiomargarita nelsonii TaxID=1003181 RepID=A0A0A6RPU6_9GAMM|nr:hypothetical protein PN36_25785 [Candidatus Thiomargarita nelsonii]
MALTYGPDGNYDSTVGQTWVDVEIATDPDGFGQATAILRAGERFRGAENVPEVDIEMTACLLDGDECGNKFFSSATLQERRAPVVLIHGLWADKSSWVHEPWMTDDEGVEPMLIRHHFEVGFFNYNQNQGPTQVMGENARKLSDTIKSGSLSDPNNPGIGVCNRLVLKGFACTRADLVVHSMGGLVARKFIFDNARYRSHYNYVQGSIRRLITLATPHQGSQLANLLLLDNANVNNCIRDDDTNTQGIQNDDLNEAIEWLDFGGKRVDGGAIADLAVGGTLLTQLNSQNQEVYTYALFGDVGQQIDLNSTGDYLVEKQIEEAGCTYQDIFGNENSDGIVPIPSAQGRVTQNASLGNVLHVGMGARDDVATRVITLLNGNLNEFAQFASFLQNKTLFANLQMDVPRKQESNKNGG